MLKWTVFHLFLVGSLAILVHSQPIASPLNGKHLRISAVEFVTALEIRRNTTGYVTSCVGTMCDYIIMLSKTLNFSYSFLPVGPTENVVGNLASVNYVTDLLIRDKTDYVLGALIGTPGRNQVSDLASYWLIGPFGFLVPYPSKSIDVKSALKIFTLEVWAAIMGSILAMILYFRFTLTGMFQPIQKQQNLGQNKYQVVNNQKLNGQINNFVLGNLVSQGQHLLSKRLFIRFAAGAWCLGCFFLVQMYSTTLTSHLMAPNQRPIANNMHELANTPGLGLTIDRGFALHQLLPGIPFGDYEKLYNKIKKDPHSLCNSTAVCLKRLRDDGNVAYSAPYFPLKFIMKGDLDSSGKCHYYLMKDTVLSTPIHTMLQKRSPYTEIVNIEIQRYLQAGLFDKWESKYVPTPRQCMELETRRDNKLRRLSLSDLISAFIILGVGYLLSLLFFLLEIIIKRFLSLNRSPVS